MKPYGHDKNKRAWDNVAEPSYAWHARSAHLKLKQYVDTYISVLEKDNEISPEVFLDDMIYGIATALNSEFKYATGYEKFKKQLAEQFLVDALKGK